MSVAGEKRVIFATATPDGRLVVLESGAGLRFIMDTSPNAGELPRTVNESDILRFRMKSTAPRQSIRALQTHLRQWLAQRESRTAIYRLTIMPESCVGDEDVVVTGSASPPIILNYDDGVALERAIAEWLSRGA